MTGRLDAAHRGHVQVHDDDVGRELADVCDGLGAGRCLADDDEILLLEQVAQTCAEEVVIVHEEHAKRLCLAFLGRLHELSHRESPLSRRLV